MTDSAEGPGADSGAVAGPTEDGAARSGLWDRLMAGQVTEVCVLSRRGLSLDLPQTLGLEVINYDAYRYGSFGVPRAPEERERFARELAAEPRWLAAAGGPRYWVEPFARRAEVILVMPGTTAAELDFALSNAIDAAFKAVGRFLEAALTRRRRRSAAEPYGRRDRPVFMVDSDASTNDYAGDGPMTDSEMNAYFMRMRNYLVGEYPDKTFVLGAADQVRELRSVRARPRG